MDAKEIAEYVKEFTDNSLQICYGEYADKCNKLAKSYLDLLEQNRWRPANEEPPTMRDAIRSMWIISNAGFVTVGYWYPETKRWVDAGPHEYDITSQVTRWKPLSNVPEDV